MNISLELWWVGIFSFLSALLLQIRIWRMRPQRRTLSTLITLYLFIPLVAYAYPLLQGAPFLDWVSPLITHCLLAINYIAIYPAFQASSPTIVILEHLHHYSHGVSEENLLKQFEGDTILEDRISDLEKSNLILKTKEGCALTSKGNLLATFFLGFRKTLNLPLGGG